MSTEFNRIQGFLVQVKGEFLMCSSIASSNPRINTNINKDCASFFTTTDDAESALRIAYEQSLKKSTLQFIDWLKENNVRVLNAVDVWMRDVSSFRRSWTYFEIGELHQEFK